MSHFVVVVIGDDPEGQLEPYDEAPTDERYLEFTDDTDSVMDEWENGDVDIVFDPDKSMWVTRYSYPYYNMNAEELRELGFDTFSQQEYAEKNGWTMEEWVEHWFGYRTEIDSMTGERGFGYMSNPNAKWDWYCIGGRWTGYFKVKKGAPSEIGERGVFGTPPKPGYADQLLRGDIDLEGMFKDALAAAAKRLEEYRVLTEGLTPAPTWEEVRESYDDIEEAREQYNNHPWVKALQSTQLVHFTREPREVFCVRDDGSIDTELYFNNAKCMSILPFAFLVDGEWHEKGDMGWFGISFNNKENYDWNAEFLAYFENLDPDTLITVVDCHI